MVSAPKVSTASPEAPLASSAANPDPTSNTGMIEKINVNSGFVILTGPAPVFDDQYVTRGPFSEIDLQTGYVRGRAGFDDDKRIGHFTDGEDAASA